MLVLDNILLSTAICQLLQLQKMMTAESFVRECTADVVLPYRRDTRARN